MILTDSRNCRYDYYKAQSDMAQASVHNNPLYESNTNQGSNPLCNGR